MYTQFHSQRVAGLSVKSLWDTWTDIGRWSEWQPDIERAQIEGEFRKGNVFLLRPKGGPNVKMELTDVVPNVRFIDLTRFPLAEMVGVHEIISHGNEIELRTTISVLGPLSFLWTRLVAKEVVAGLPEQTRLLIARARATEAVGV